MFAHLSERSQGCETSYAGGSMVAAIVCNLLMIALHHAVTSSKTTLLSVHLSLPRVGHSLPLLNCLNKPTCHSVVEPACLASTSATSAAALIQGQEPGQDLACLVACLVDLALRTGPDIFLGGSAMPCSGAAASPAPCCYPGAQHSHKPHVQAPACLPWLMHRLGGSAGDDMRTAGCSFFMHPC
jgi:hypothetical protein